jgi:hypothetical protein
MFRKSILIIISIIRHTVQIPVRPLPHSLIHLRLNQCVTLTCWRLWAVHPSVALSERDVLEIMTSVACLKTLSPDQQLALKVRTVTQSERTWRLFLKLVK